MGCEMGEFKGTKGPLALSKESHKTIVSGSFIDGYEGYLVASTYGNDTSGFYASEEEARHNAVLFVAAPDMLAALQSVLECFDCTDGRVWTNSSKRRAFDDAHAAVKLALGEKE